MSTFGPDFEFSKDGHRILKQHEIIRDFMLDGKWRTLREISVNLGYPEASVSAQLRHLRKPRFGCYTVKKRRKTVGTWEYQVLTPGLSDKQGNNYE